MDVMTLTYPDVLVRMDDAVIESFKRIVVGRSGRHSRGPASS